MSPFGAGVILIVIGAVVNIAGIVDWEFGEVLGRNIVVVPLSGFALGALIIGSALWILGTYLVVVAHGKKEEDERRAESLRRISDSQLAQLQSVGITTNGNRVTIAGGDAARIATREINYLIALRRDGQNEAADKIISGRKDQELAVALLTLIKRYGPHSTYRAAYLWAAEQLKDDA